MQMFLGEREGRLSLAIGLLLGACGASSGASSNGSGCPSGQTHCSSCGGAGFCSQACPDYACPANDDGAADATNDSLDGGACPSASSSLCADCGGRAFCVSGSCPAFSCPASAGPYPFPLPPAGDAGDGGPFGAIYAQCAALPSRPLTAGSYTEPKTGLTLHWPDGWTLSTSPGLLPGTISTPCTYVPTGATAAVADEARVTISVSSFGNASQPPQFSQNWMNWASQNGGDSSKLTLGGHPAIVWWDLEPVPVPGCVSGCAGPPGSPEIVHVGAAIDFAVVDGGGAFGVEVDVQGQARADAQPQQVFCDMEAMMLGLTFAH
jgi:hypothetical protein